MQVKGLTGFSVQAGVICYRPSVNRQVIGSSPIAGASFVAFDLRFLLIRDRLGDSPARRRLCWLVLIMAVRGFARAEVLGCGGARLACLRAGESVAGADSRTCVRLTPAAVADDSRPLAAPAAAR